MNNVLGMIMGADGVPGNPGTGVELQPIDFVRFAERLRRHRLSPRAARAGSAAPAAAAAEGPALCAVVDPFEPPLPSRVTAKQALHGGIAGAWRAQPCRIALTLFRDKVRDLRGS